MDRLASMLEMQRSFQEKLNGYTLEEQTEEQRITNFKISMFALIAELYEAINEMGWKEWATSRHINRDAAVKELIDAWHFFMNLLLHMGVDSDELYEKYVTKLATNIERQENGYDGVATKCLNCQRALDDMDAKEVFAQSTQRVDIHCVCGAYLGSRAV
jgi:hypothetical protein